METRRLGDLWPVSALTLGGGGLGQIWGMTDRDEAVATVRLGVERGITLLDLAPSYGRGEAEMVAGAAFEGAWPEGLRVTTKCILANLPASEVHERLERSLRRSLETLRREQVDLFFLHSNIHPTGYIYLKNAETQGRWALPWMLYVEVVVPAFERLKAQGLIGDWGITGVGLPRMIMDALREEAKPAVVQAVANLLDSAGDMRRYEEPPEPRNIIRTAKNNGVGVMGIRAVQAGALTAKIDRELPADSAEVKDYAKAEPYRALASELGEDPAILAHRYALAMEGVDTVVLGVKNRQELTDILDAEAKGPLDAEIVRRIDALGLRRQVPRLPLDAPL